MSYCRKAATAFPLRIVRPGLVLPSSRARHEQRRQNTHHHIPPRFRVACPMTRVQMAIQMVGATSHFIGFALQLRVQNRMGWSVLATGPVSECCRFALHRSSLQCLHPLLLDLLLNERPPRGMGLSRGVRVLESRGGRAGAETLGQGLDPSEPSSSVSRRSLRWLAASRVAFLQCMCTIAFDA